MTVVYSEMCFRAVQELVYTKFRDATDAQFWGWYMDCMEETTGQQRRTL